MIDNSKEYIVCAAVKRLDGSFDCGYRHNNIYEKVPQEDITKIYGIDFLNDMGFLTSKGRFVNRVEAFQIALDCGQVTHKVYNETIDNVLGIDSNDSKYQIEFLASEDLY